MEAFGEFKNMLKTKQKTVSGITGYMNAILCLRQKMPKTRACVAIIMPPLELSKAPGKNKPTSRGETSIIFKPSLHTLQTISSLYQHRDTLLKNRFKIWRGNDPRIN